MSGTNCAKRDLKSITARYPVLSSRSLLAAMITLALLLVIGWIKSNTWNKLDQLERDLAVVEAETFFLGVRLRDGVGRMNGALLRYQLSKADWVEHKYFDATAAELQKILQVNLPRLTTAEEKSAAAEVQAAFQTYLTNCGPFFERTLRAVRRDSSSQVQEQIGAISQPLINLCDNLATIQHQSWGRFLLDTRSALLTLQRLALLSTGMLLALGTTFGVLVYRIAVAPLHRRLLATQTLMERQEKLAALGTLAAGVAHEIRNPLTAIKFRLFSLKKKLVDRHSETEDMQVIDGEINRLERIVKDFLLYARPSDPERTDIPTQTLLDSIFSLLHPQLDKQEIRLKIEADASVRIRVDKQQMEQVLINLVQNGAESIGAKGEIILRTRSAPGGFAGIASDSVLIEVADTGKGIPPDVQKRLFDPFVSTKQGGTGLGLAIAERIVEKHGGRILFTTQLNRGTTFQIVLPIAT
jgi:signal transduction histidine kinase